jgi:hypothetical protein
VLVNITAKSLVACKVHVIWYFLVDFDSLHVISDS